MPVMLIELQKRAGNRICKISSETQGKAIWFKKGLEGLCDIPDAFLLLGQGILASHVGVTSDPEGGEIHIDNKTIAPVSPIYPWSVRQGSGSSSKGDYVEPLVVPTIAGFWVASRFANYSHGNHPLQAGLTSFHSSLTLTTGVLARIMLTRLPWQEIPLVVVIIL